MLLDKGANPNARQRLPILPGSTTAATRSSVKGATPLMRAARGRDLPVMKLLLAKGANPNLFTRTTPRR
jgi:ankyrin repeat protein